MKKIKKLEQTHKKKAGDSNVSNSKIKRTNTTNLNDAA
jgi:hypothetical protein